ncbi:hypothetical protein PENTCL1PPCAC_2833, partial [Pristionchus entomophagus]
VVSLPPHVLMADHDQINFHLRKANKHLNEVSRLLKGPAAAANDDEEIENVDSSSLPVRSSDTADGSAAAGSDSDIEIVFVKQASSVKVAHKSKKTGVRGPYEKQVEDRQKCP